MPEDVHTNNVEALRNERAAVEAQPDADKDRLSEIDKQIARAEKAIARGKRGVDRPETADDTTPSETAVPPGPISKSRQAQHETTT